MEKERNAYEIIGTNRYAVERIKNVLDKDRFIQEKANDTIKQLNMKIEIAEKLLEENSQDDADNRKKLQQKILDLKNKIKLVENAFREVCNEQEREIYNSILDLYIERENTTIESEMYSIERRKNISTNNMLGEQEEIADKNLKKQSAIIDLSEEYLEKLKEKIIKRRAIPDNAYEILQTTREKCNDNIKTSQNIDEYLLKRKNGLIREKEIELERIESVDSNRDFKKIQRVRLEIGRIKEAYEKIATKAKRESYDDTLKELQEKRQEQIKQSKLREKYKRNQYYNPGCIQELVYENIDGIKIKLKREDGEEILLKKIGRIGYKTNYNMIAEINEYEIVRIVNGEEKKDIIYTNLNESKLQLKQRGNKDEDKKYYKYIVDELFSEESIEECKKYNKGYLGKVGKNKDGNYERNFKDIEELSAVMKFYVEKSKYIESERKNKVEKEEEEYEH